MITARAGISEAAAAAPAPPDSLLNRLKRREPGSAGAVEALAKIDPLPRLIDDFQPVARSLEWRLSEMQWDLHGASPFLEGTVPYTINNSGRLSSCAAEVLFASCVAEPPRQPLALLELGAGSGLFARQLLDEFRRLCRERHAGYYDLLVFYVSDHSPRTVEQWRQLGMFDEHRAHVVSGVCDALRPGRIEPPGGEAVELGGLRAVFCNYLLDSLPFAILRKGETGIEELHIRTHLTADTGRMRQYTALDIDEIRSLVRTQDASATAELLRVVSLFEFEAGYFRPKSLPPLAEEAVSFGAGLNRVFVNYGAIQCIEAALGLLAAEGWILVNDYGPVAREQIAEQSSPQRFGPSAALGVNFPLLEHHLALRGDCAVLKPDGDDSLPIHPRLISRRGPEGAREAFLRAFSLSEQRAMDAPVEEARQHIEAERLEAAMAAYRRAVEARPRDWLLLGEVAEFLTRRLSDYKGGLELARLALEINPWCSAWLWNLLGDALYALDRFDEAHECYLSAERIHPADVRTNLNLAYSYLQMGRHRQALEAAAVGLAYDGQGIFRERLLAKQQHILSFVGNRWTSEQEWLARRAQRLR